ncbi:hypothetical protein D3C81_1291680 [compost metagenome]
MVEGNVEEINRDPHTQYTREQNRLIIRIQRHDADGYVDEQIRADDRVRILVDQQKRQQLGDHGDDEHNVACPFVRVSHVGRDGTADSADDDQRKQDFAVHLDHDVGQDAEGDHSPDDFDE